MKEPGPDHPIAIARSPHRVTVKRGGVTLARTDRALSLKEASYPAVFYIPRADADMALFEPSARKTHCPYKGEASYFSLNVAGERADNAVWSYEAPFPAVADIAGHLAFYPDKVEIVEDEA